MSLVTDDIRRTLYNNAISNYEHASLSFWTYMFKAYFPEKNLFYDREKPASELADPLRRVDGAIRYLEHGSSQIRVLCFHEAKKTYASDSDMKDVEGQAWEACATYCGNSHFTHVFAITTIGTRARTWKYTVEEGMVSLSGSTGLLNREAYIDADSTAASQIEESFKHMKQFPPSRIAGAGYSNEAVARIVSPGKPVPSTSTGGQSSEFSEAQMDGKWHFSSSHQKYYRYDSKKKGWEFPQ